MVSKDLCELLYTADAFGRQEEAIIQRTLVMLMQKISQVVPARDAGDISNILSDFVNTMTDARLSRLNGQEYFSARGPVAKKIREHIAIDDWVRTQIAEVSFKKGPAVNADTLGFLENSLSAFDFKPVTDKAIIDDLFDFFRHMRETMAKGAFTGQPAVLGQSLSFQETSTGIYGPSEDIAKAAIILNVHSADGQGMDTVFIGNYGTAPLMWHFHPHERIWVAADFKYTFPYIRAQLELEFDKALKGCGYVPPELSGRNNVTPPTYVGRHLH